LDVCEHDIPEARRLLSAAVPLVGDLLGLDQARSRTLINFLDADFNSFVAPAILAGTRPRLVTGLGLANAAHCSRPMLYGHLDWLAEAAEDCGLGLLLLLAARGDFLEHTVWRISELDSPVGRAAKGAGIADGSHLQRLLGPMLTGADMHVPGLLSPPGDEHLDERRLAHQLDGMIARIDNVAARVAAYADAADNNLLRRFALTDDALRAYTAPRTLLVPRLTVGPQITGGRLTELGADIGTLMRTIKTRRFDNAIVETNDDAYARRSRPDWIDSRLVSQLLAKAVTFRFDITVRAAEVSYAVTPRSGHWVLHRRQHDDDRRSRAIMVAAEASFALIGFDLDPRCATRFDPELARAILYTELLATSTHPSDCGTRFGEKLAPSYAKPPGATPRAFIRALRTISNSALVAVARQRQAADLAA
jgi:hypothetical protein